MRDDKKEPCMVEFLCGSFIVKIPNHVFFMVYMLKRHLDKNEKFHLGC